MVDLIFSRVNPVDKFVKLLRKASYTTQTNVLLRLMEYRYGRPRPAPEGEDTLDAEFKKVIVLDIPRPDRTQLGLPSPQQIAAQAKNPK